MRGPLLVALLLVVLILAGCVSNEAPGKNVGTKKLGGAAVPTQPGFGLDKSALTQPVYEMLPKTRHYIPALQVGDKVRLYAEAFLPKGAGPWPAILINSPYYEHGLNGATDLEATFREYFVKRGYAVVLADVRGTGLSEGCMNMMGAKEQKDTYDLVEWVAAQAWSDGRVGMYGVSYVGTTPGEALIMAPPHLVTVVTVAGVTNQWRNMYQNGVPYQGRFYPLTYEVLEGAPPPTDPERGADWAANVAAGGCEQEEALRHVAPGTYEKGVYDSYWKERNFTLKAKDAKASLFYNQGFIDRAVNPMESIYWYNELPVPKKAFFGQWPHQTPARKDWQPTLNAWFDYWLKGLDNGIMDTAPVEVVTNLQTIRTDDEWPPSDAVATRFYLGPGQLNNEPPPAGKATYTHDPADPFGADEGQVPASVRQSVRTTWLSYESDALRDEFYLAGIPWANLRASVNAENTYFFLRLYDVDGSRWNLVQEGWMNAHLWESFDKSSPLTPNQEYTFRFKFEPREYVFPAGHKVGLRILGHDAAAFPFDKAVTDNTVYYGGENPSYIELPRLQAPAVVPMPGDIAPTPLGHNG